MDFGSVLDKWEKKNRSYPDRDEKEQDDSSFGVNFNGKNKSGRKKGISVPARIRELRKMIPQAELDLHGMTSDEAKKALWNFLAESRNKGLSKILIIHGKGLHSGNGGVLKKVVDEVLKDCPFAGMTGIPDSRYGGSGARWVILK